MAGGEEDEEKIPDGHDVLRLDGAVYIYKIEAKGS